jgi:hypothetical protein
MNETLGPIRGTLADVRMNRGSELVQYLAPRLLRNIRNMRRE